MNYVVLLTSCILASLVTLAEANAQARVTETTKFYKITGKTGTELLFDMNRKGPKHGLLTKAIAQTQFKTKFEGDVLYSKGYCSAKNAGYALTITYIYPQPDKPLTGALARRWKAFQSTNIVHEKKHGAIAKKMAHKVARKVRGFRERDKPGCRASMAKLAREIDALIEAQNAEQAAFDKKEHRAHGPVEKSILALVRK